ncbi:MAG TPA: GntR family transcriptional regulator [Tepidisphaeraceae bacterium]|jgi:DNA-binding LacI/PurR family transcriptional regulator|nr:GntR family transcriptional regulator [Tepidisphaeraceae bacterium]
MIESTGIEAPSSVYEALAERLRKSIRRGDFQPGQLLGSEHELARQQSISRMTVRRASEILVSEGLIERRPGRGLYVCSGSVGTTLVQVVAGNLEWEPSLQVSRGVQQVARQRGIQVQLYDAHGDELLDLEMLRRLPGGMAKGAVIVSLHGPRFNEAVYELRSKRFPFVLADQRLHDIEVPSVTADNYAGGYDVGKLLLGNGHRRIAFVGDLVASTVRDRLSGLRDAIADAGVAFDRSLVVDLLADKDRLGDWSAHIEKAVSDLMSRPTPPTAVFFSCDGVARPGLRAMLRMGIRVPHDVSIVGFDDDPIAEWLQPGLTTVRQPFAQMGEAAIDLLCKLIADPNAKVEHHTLPVQLVERGSVGPVRSA